MKKSNSKGRKINANKHNKRVKWGAISIHEIPVVSSKAILREEINALSLTEINQIIQQDNETSKRFLCKNGLMAILEKANDASQSIEEYDSCSFKSIIYKYSQKNKDINDIFVGFRIYLITKKFTNIREQVFDDFESVMANNTMIHESAESKVNSDASNESTNYQSEFHNDILDEPEGRFYHAQPNHLVASSKKNDENSIYNANIQALYLWLEQFPEWLQDQILNSTPIQIMIAETKKIAEVLDSNFVQNQIEKIFIAESSNKSEDFFEDKQSPRVAFIDSSSRDLVDTDMVHEDSSVMGLILPTLESNGAFIIF